MAVNTTYLDSTQAQQDRSIKVIKRVVALPASGITSGDNIQVLKLPIGIPGTIVGASLKIDGTIGASATLKMQIFDGVSTRTDLTAATTAGAAGRVTSALSAGVPYDFSGGETFELLLGGANIGAAANATLIVETINR